MNFLRELQTRNSYQKSHFEQKTLLQLLHIDLPLLAALSLLTCAGFLILYSAGNEDFYLVKKQCFHIILAFMVMIGFAQIPPATYRRWSPLFYTAFVLMLVCVLIVGHINNGAQRWLNLGIIKFQPSELLKIAIPLFLATLFSNKELPIGFKEFIVGSIIIMIPTILTIKEPDLGTGILLAASGFSLLFLAGLRMRIIIIIALLGMIAAPFLWHHLHGYQQERLLTFFNPERDPLGAGYHIIQSKITLGSGGLFGKGWLQGTQSHLHYLPENTTDFIFAVCGEEFGFIGCLILILLYLLVITRGFLIARRAQDTFTRLLASTLTLGFFFSFFINMGMVTGILPVVGLPLPLVSYGGTSMVTMLANFGILMSISTHRTLLKR